MWQGSEIAASYETALPVKLQISVHSIIDKHGIDFSENENKGVQ